MASGNRESLNYWSTLGDTFVRKVQPGTPGAVTRKNKDGNAVSEISVDWLEGRIVGLKIHEREYQGKTFKYLSVNFHDGDCLQLSWYNGEKASRACDCFMYLLENIKLDDEVRFTLSVTEEVKNGKAVKKTTLFARQNGVPVKWYYKKDHAGLKPDWVQYTTPDGDVKYSRKKEYEYFEMLVNRINDEIRSSNKLNQHIDQSMGVEKAMRVEEPAFDSGYPDNSFPVEDDDDLPF